jgi:hypothetical protein
MELGWLAKLWGYNRGKKRCQKNENENRLNNFPLNALKSTTSHVCQRFAVPFYLDFQANRCVDTNLKSSRKGKQLQPVLSPTDKKRLQF